MKKIDTSNYKGVRDFYPEDMFIQDYITSVWHEVMQSYGFEHYSASILESTELYESKTSEEIVKDQTYNFIDRGDRKVTLRPEMTPTVARMIAKKERELSFPLRWYSIPNLFRYERPQKGRLREHWQLNADIFGISGINAEAEIIEVAYQIMMKFGLKENDFVIRINDRKILDKVFEDLKLDEKQSAEFRKLLDKKDKIEDFNDQAFKIIGKNYDTVIEPNKEITELIEKLNNRGINNVVFDPNMVRGFDYYTGTVFEIFDTNPENRRSIFGGGRYDNLLEVFGNKKISSIGFGMGDVMFREVLESKNLLPKIKSKSILGISILDEESIEYSNNLAKEFRNNNINTLIHYPNKKVGDQIKYFDKKKIPFVLVIGKDEVGSGKLTIKKLSDGKETNGDLEDIIKFIKTELDK